MPQSDAVNRRIVLAARPRGLPTPQDFRPNLNIHLHCLVLDGVYRTTEGVPAFHPVPAPAAEELQALLTRLMKRLMNRMHRDVQL